MFISLGKDCWVAHQIRRTGQYDIFPLDYVGTDNFPKIANVILNNWVNFLDKTRYEKITHEDCDIPNLFHTFWMNKEDSIYVPHDDLDDFDSFVEKYIKKIELFNKHVAKGVTFIREDAKKEDFIEFIKNFPNSKGILVNYDVKPKFVCRDEIVTEWYIQKPTEVNWEKRNNENLVWDIILRS